MIKQYTKKDGTKLWYFKSYLGIDPLTGKKKYTTRRGFKTKKEANIAMSRLQLKVSEDGFDHNNKVTFQEVYDMWIVHYENTVKRSTFSVQKDAIRLHVLPLFGTLKINKITIKHCQAQVDSWYNYYKKYSNLIGLTSAIFDFAFSLELVKSNPMKLIIRPKRKKQIDDVAYKSPFYDREQLEKFFDCLKDNNDQQLLTMFRILAFTGLRKGELLALRWSDINIFNKTLTVSQTLAKGEDNQTFFQTPKTEHSHRTISLDEITLTMINDWKKHQQKLYLKLGYNTNKPEQLIFTTEENNHLYLDFLNNNLKRLKAYYGFPKITVHGFRHTHCSLLFEAGASIKEVQVRLGHSDINTTMNIYAHVTDKAKEETADKFASYVNF